jgi:hypothetical protein
LTFMADQTVRGSSICCSLFVYLTSRILLNGTGLKWMSRSIGSLSGPRIDRSSESRK